MMRYITEELDNYEVLAELAVLYATKMDTTYQQVFFEKNKDKFLKELKHLNGETMYKIIWSMLKVDSLAVQEDSHHWIEVKKMIIKRAKEFDSKILASLMVLSTKEKRRKYQEKDFQKTDAQIDSKDDLFTLTEEVVIVKIKEMKLDDLINMLWAALEVNRGSNLFFETIEGHLTK